jgi:hypothetical protein
MHPGKKRLARLGYSLRLEDGDLPEQDWPALGNNTNQPSPSPMKPTKIALSLALPDPPKKQNVYAARRKLGNALQQYFQEDHLSGYGQGHGFSHGHAWNPWNSSYCHSVSPPRQGLAQIVHIHPIQDQKHFEPIEQGHSDGHAHGHGVDECAGHTSLVQSTYHQSDDELCANPCCPSLLPDDDVYGPVRLNAHCNFGGHCIQLKNTFVHIECNHNDEDESGDCFVCSLTRFRSRSCDLENAGGSQAGIPIGSASSESRSRSTAERPIRTSAPALGEAMTGSRGWMDQGNEFDDDEIEALPW